MGEGEDQGYRTLEVNPKANHPEKIPVNDGFQPRGADGLQFARDDGKESIAHRGFESQGDHHP